MDSRIRVYVWDIENTTDGKPNNRKLLSEETLYLDHDKWCEINITSSVKRLLLRRQKDYYEQAIEVEISDAFNGIGEKDWLNVETDLKSSFRPFILIFSSKTISKSKKEPKLQFTARKRRSLTSYEWEEDPNAILDGIPNPIFDLSNLLADDKKLGKKARKRRAKNACKRKPLTIVFKDIGWDHWIIAPQFYEAYQCSGKCFYPLASHLTPTKHAVVQNLVHSLHPDQAARACCVPTKLGPISLLYLEAGVPTYNYEYSEMVVLECGCR